MNFSLILIIAFVLIGILYLFCLVLFLKIKQIEQKLVDISYDEVNLLVNELRELIIESERVSEKLDNGIREKESLLEDLVDLVDAKLNRYEMLESNLEKEKSLKDKILQLHKSGKSMSEIAKELDVSVTEVNLVIKLLNENR
ncbi:hypothetical protein DEFDS_0434 [Deferribacter desulfuricans SSM1]|uniref:Uncharacterized protein n=1 Tax=Deferribacter desulfuricans (strain DSM 14783 / JCM 11476 / NBRC 101012 / SSM1) TaxID=639282 RepID=D3PBF5_DEFDS|nr:hypothetical protein [Deferribacter desulfuricans]BAI79928.1 hypothetical protein DEFDS_0434 [Deferribacter desulfuricans SSM1]